MCMRRNKRQRAEGREILTPEVLNVLSEGLQHELQDAVDTIDFDGVMTIIDQIRPQYPTLAKALTKLVKGYRFDTLQQLFVVD